MEDFRKGPANEVSRGGTKADLPQSRSSIALGLVASVHGDVTSDKYCKNRTARICDLMEEKYGLTIAKKQRRGKSIDNDKIPIKKKVKMKIQEAISKEIEKGVSDINKLKAALKGQGIGLNFHPKAFGSEVRQGNRCYIPDWWTYR